MFNNLQRTLVVCGFMVASLGLAPAAVINFGPITVLSTDTISGQSITLPGAAAATDTFSVTASGIVSLQGNGIFGTNAAGVVILPGSSGVGQSLANGATSFGSLLFGNGSLGLKQVFPTNAANGLGSLAPPSTLSTTVTVGSLFGGPLAAGTNLQLRVSDTFTGDNFGQFSVTTLSLTTADPVPAGVPEPATWLLSATALAGAIVFRRYRATN